MFQNYFKITLDNPLEVPLVRGYYRPLPSPANHGVLNNQPKNIKTLPL